jgi:hypothetical protein
MACRPWLAGLFGLLTLAELARAQTLPVANASGSSGPVANASGSSSPVANASGSSAPLPHIPTVALPADLRASVQAVLDQPTLSAKGPVETFNAVAGTYRWLLEHPDHGVKLWRLLGARVTDIEDRGGTYYWKDAEGTDMHWRIVYRDSSTQAWYAEGKAKATFLLPAAPFRAVVVLKYTTGTDLNDRPAIRHQVSFVLRCDSRAMALAARILGASAPHLAEQYLAQLQLFYGGLAWYLGQDQTRCRKLFQRAGLSVPAAVSH